MVRLLVVASVVAALLVPAAGDQAADERAWLRARARSLRLSLRPLELRREPATGDADLVSAATQAAVVADHVRGFEAVRLVPARREELSGRWEQGVVVAHAQRAAGVAVCRRAEGVGAIDGRDADPADGVRSGRPRAGGGGRAPDPLMRFSSPSLTQR